MIQHNQDVMRRYVEQQQLDHDGHGIASACVNCVGIIADQSTQQQGSINQQVEPKEKTQMNADEGNSQKQGNHYYH